jgi:hypothetical protein
MKRDILKKGMIITLEVTGINNDIATVTLDGTRTFDIPASSVLKSIKDPDALVQSLDAKSRFELLLKLKTDKTKKKIMGGSVVQLMVNDRLRHGVVIGFNDDEVNVWVVGTDRLRFISCSWSCILPIGERVSVGMDSQPHTIPIDTFDRMNRKFQF